MKEWDVKLFEIIKYLKSYKGNKGRIFLCK